MANRSTETAKHHARWIAGVLSLAALHCAGASDVTNADTNGPEAGENAGTASPGETGTAGGSSGGGAAGRSNTGGGDTNAAGASLGAGGNAGKTGVGGASGSPNVGGHDASVQAVDSGLLGTSGVWENVTPKGINLDAKFVPADNYGVMDVLANPAHPGMFYAFVCYQGVWRSIDWGATWSKVDTDGNLEQGRPWGEAIAPDGSYMLACTGYGTARWGAWKSIDGGVTWAKYAIADNSDPYMFDIDPSDKNHVISSSHSTDHIYESHDAGQTWTDRGSSGAGESDYVFFITSTTWLAVAQSGSGGTRRTTNSGGAWTTVGTMEHVHGGEQIFIDPNTHAIYVGAHSSSSGVFQSTDGGASFTRVSGAQSASVFGTGSRIYSMDSGANLAGNPPAPASATRSKGTDWASFAVPAGMTNGPKRADVALDPSTGKWVVVSGSWLAGIWRYIEP